MLRGLNFNVAGGECLVLHGRSGAGKSTLLRTLYGNYLPAGGSIRLRHAGDWLELVGAEPREVLAVRRQTLGYVSQFLRVIPRVATSTWSWSRPWPVAGAATAPNCGRAACWPG